MLIVDTNERGPIISLLMQSGIDIRRENIDIDYTDEKRSFVVERKTLNDFKESVIKGHLKKQCEYMLKTYPDVPKFILLEGTIEDAVAISRKAGGLIESFFYRAPHIYHVQILETVDVTGTIRALKGIMKYAPGASKLLERGALEMPPKTPDPRIRTLMTFPGVGRKLAEQLLQHFGTLMDVFHGDITEIHGVGKGKAEAFKRFLE